MNDVITQLAATIATRRETDPQQSYVASLHHKGLNKILEKVSEEATEAILAAKENENGGPREDVISEVADLWFHSMVMLSHLEIDVSEVLQCLSDRSGVSGLEEKASRNS